MSSFDRRILLIVAIFAALLGCAVAIGEGATTCVDLDTRSALVVDGSASAPPKERSRPETPASSHVCQGGGSTS